MDGATLDGGALLVHLSHQQFHGRRSSVASQGRCGDEVSIRLEQAAPARGHQGRHQGIVLPRGQGGQQALPLLGGADLQARQQPLAVEAQVHAAQAADGCGYHVRVRIGQLISQDRHGLGVPHRPHRPRRRLAHRRVRVLQVAEDLRVPGHLSQPRHRIDAGRHLLHLLGLQQAFQHQLPRHLRARVFQALEHVEQLSLQGRAARVRDQAGGHRLDHRPPRGLRVFALLGRRHAPVVTRFEGAAHERGRGQPHLDVFVVQPGQALHEHRVAHTGGGERFQSRGPDARVLVLHQGQGHLGGRGRALPQQLDAHLAHPVVLVQQQAAGVLARVGQGLAHGLHGLLVVQAHALLAEGPHQHLAVAVAQTPAGPGRDRGNDQEHAEELAQRQHALGVQGRDAGAQQSPGQHEATLHDHARAVAVALRHQLHQHLVAGRDDAVQQHVIQQVEAEDHRHHGQRQPVAEHGHQRRGHAGVDQADPQVDAAHAQPAQNVAQQQGGGEQGGHTRHAEEQAEEGGDVALLRVVLARHHVESVVDGRVQAVQSQGQYEKELEIGGAAEVAQVLRQAGAAATVRAGHVVAADQRPHEGDDDARVYHGQAVHLV